MEKKHYKDQRDQEPNTLTDLVREATPIRNSFEKDLRISKLEAENKDLKGKLERVEESLMSEWDEIDIAAEKWEELQALEGKEGFPITHRDCLTVEYDYKNGIVHQRDLTTKALRDE
jgi:hypothetical protein